MFPRAVLCLCFIACLCCGAQEDLLSQDLLTNGQAWTSTIYEPYDQDRDEATYKVFTHLYDFDGDGFLTKGAGGKYTHHRGLFIGWKDTMVNGEDLDTWHMKPCYQEHVQWRHVTMDKGEARQEEVIAWRKAETGEAFIEETRTIALKPAAEGLRVVDFLTELRSKAGEIELKGDLHHAGMQVRLANEVSEHEETTEYILPEGAERQGNDQVVGAWWACVSAEVEGQRYWIMHMTPPSHPTGVPVYSIRPYARFGAFWEDVLPADEALNYQFRVVVSKDPLDRDACAQLYDVYAQEVGQQQ